MNRSLHIISGAQTGADVAGLWSAKLFGIPTGGYAPKNFVTLDGNHPEMAATFGIKEHSSLGYRDRTIANLKGSDITIVCSEKLSPGTRLTINQCKKENVPCYYFSLDPSDMEASLANANLDKVIHEIRRHEMLNLPFVLNIAGNSTQNSTRVFEFTFKVCHKLFSTLGYTSEIGAEKWIIYKDKWN